MTDKDYLEANTSEVCTNLRTSIENYITEQIHHKQNHEFDLKIGTLSKIKITKRKDSHVIQAMDYDNYVPVTGSIKRIAAHIADKSYQKWLEHALKNLQIHM